jgi:nuclear cap-binding protein subunit 1
MFEGEGIFPLLDELFLRAADLQTKSSDDSLGLELVKIILVTIPYTLASSANGIEAQASSLLEKTDIIASTPHILDALVDPFPSLQPGAPSSSESALALLQRHMQEEAKNGWPLSCLPRPWRPTERAPADEDYPLSDAQKQTFPSIALPETMPVGPVPIYPEVYFSVYSDQEVATVPPASDTSSILLRDAINDTINILHVNRYIAARVLIDVDLFFAPRTFVHRGTAFDKVADSLADGQIQWKPEDVVVDACFANLFQLPAPEHKLVYYHSILTEACRLQPSAVAPSLGRAIRYLYRNVDRMDMTLNNRLLEWFAHHLSNFGFTWKWTEWTEDLQLSDLTPKKAFIIDSIDKEIRLSFAARIRGTLPPDYEALIAKEKEIDAPMPKYEKEDTPFSATFKEIVQSLRKRAPIDEVKPLLEKVEGDAQAAGYDAAQAKTVVLDVLITSIAWVGSKSLSHVLSITERYKPVVDELVGGDLSMQSQLIASFVEYWQYQQGVAITIILKLVNYQIVTPQGVVSWAFNPSGSDGGRNLSKVFVWEAVTGVLLKVENKVKELVRAARTPGLEDEERERVKAVLDTEMRDSFHGLLAQIKTGLQGIPQGGQGGLTEDDEALVKVWVAKWQWAMDRREKVLALWVTEELAKPIPPPPPAVEAKSEDVKMEDDQGAATNGNGTGNLNGSNGGDVDLDVVDPDIE